MAPEGQRSARGSLQGPDPQLCPTSNRTALIGPLGSPVAPPVPRWDPKRGIRSRRKGLRHSEARDLGRADSETRLHSAEFGRRELGVRLLTPWTQPRGH